MVEYRVRGHMVWQMRFARRKDNAFPAQRLVRLRVSAAS